MARLWIYRYASYTKTRNFMCIHHSIVLKQPAFKNGSRHFQCEFLFGKRDLHEHQRAKGTFVAELQVNGQLWVWRVPNPFGGIEAQHPQFGSPSRCFRHTAQIARSTKRHHGRRTNQTWGQKRKKLLTKNRMISAKKLGGVLVGWFSFALKSARSITRISDSTENVWISLASFTSSYSCKPKIDNSNCKPEISGTQPQCYTPSTSYRVLWKNPPWNICVPDNDAHVYVMYSFLTESCFACEWAMPHLDTYKRTRHHVHIWIYREREREREKQDDLIYEYIVGLFQVDVLSVKDPCVQTNIPSTSKNNNNIHIRNRHV